MDPQAITIKNRYTYALEDFLYEIDNTKIYIGNDTRKQCDVIIKIFGDPADQELKKKDNKVRI